jgi:hypothetical protein
MKKTIFLVALIISMVGHQANAQVGVSVNIGLQPVWGPSGYDHADYYYVPDVDAYYDVPAHMWVYQDGGVWVHRAALPGRYANFDLYHAYKAVVNVPQPWLHHDTYRSKYASYRGRHDQAVIRDSKDPKYFVVKDHPMHAQYHPANHPVNHPANHSEGEHREDHR